MEAMNGVYTNCLQHSTAWGARQVKGHCAVREEKIMTRLAQSICLVAGNRRVDRDNVPGRHLVLAL
jgi:hypothetical protein